MSAYLTIEVVGDTTQRGVLRIPQDVSEHGAVVCDVVYLKRTSVVTHSIVVTYRYLR